jgi:NAD+ kinase
MRRVGLLLRRGKAEAVDIAAQIAPFLRDRGHEVLAVVDDGGAARLRGIAGLRVVTEAELRGAIDLLVVLGGDGTILRGAALCADDGVPILGLNLGTLGFLSSAPPAEAEEVLAGALDGQFPIEERLRLRVEVRLVSGEVIVRHAANDAVVSQGALARLIELMVEVDGVPLTHYRADGLIVATPTGSTAYNLSAGGPIVAPEVQAVVLSPICPHTLSVRPIVLPSSGRIGVALTSPANHVQLTIDGQWGQRLQTGDRVEISRGSPPLYLFRAKQGHFGVLREKLRWGE